MSIARDHAPRVGFFVTCIVDAMRPNIGFASVKLLKEAGCDVEVPTAQTCCGQPAFNSGDDATTRRLAQQVIKAFEPYDYVVVPSGSCASMIRSHYSEVFEDDPTWRARQQAVSEKTWEILSFLSDVMHYTPQASYAGTATYHDSCSGLRELNVRQQPRALLNSLSGLELKEMTDSDVCCGFGGTFCVKYPDVSNAIVAKKTSRIAESGADTLLAGDLGCLLNMAGKMSREGRPIKARHVAEVLAGMTDAPAIGDARPLDGDE